MKMIARRIEFKRKYVVMPENADHNKIYIATSKRLGEIIEKVNSLMVEVCKTIDDTVQSAFQQSFTDGYPFQKGVIYLYDIQQQIIDENIKRT